MAATRASISASLAPWPTVYWAIERGQRKTLAKRGGAVLDMATLEKVNELGGVPGVRKHLAAIAKLREQVAEADLALKKLGGEDGASEVVELMEAFTAAQKSK